jgi:outer membrane protein
MPIKFQPSVPARRLATRLLGVSIAAAVLVGAPAVVAPTQAHAADVPSVGKVAMVDMQRVLNETKAGQKARKSLEQSSASKEKKFEKRRQELEAEVAKLRSLSGQQLAAAQEKLQQESLELQNMFMALEQELSQQQNKVLETMYRNASEIVAKLAKDKGLDLVLVRDQMTVIFAKDTLDITTEVVKLYDQKYSK